MPHFQTHISVREILRKVERPGFQDLFHEVRFEVRSHGIPPFTVSIWVHSAFPDEEIEGVAWCFFKGRLQDMHDVAAASGRYSSSEVAVLWERVKPPIVK